MVDRFKPLNREVLAKFLPNHESIRAFEKVVEAAGQSLPNAIDEAGLSADAAQALAQQAWAVLLTVSDALQTLALAPPAQPAIQDDDLEPRAELGTISSQNAEKVRITGGTIGGLTSFGVRSTGAAFDLKFASAEAITADRTLTNVLGDADRTVTYFGNTTVPIFTRQITFAGPTAARTVTLPDANFTAARTDAGQTFTGNQAITGTLSVTGALSAGNTTLGTLSASTSALGSTTTGAFGCNGAAAQGSASLGAAATDPASTEALANAIRLALIANGIGS